MAARHFRLSVAPRPGYRRRSLTLHPSMENLDLGGGCPAMYGYVYVQLHDLAHLVEMKQCKSVTVSRCTTKNFAVNKTCVLRCKSPAKARTFLTVKESRKTHHWGKILKQVSDVSLPQALHLSGDILRPGMTPANFSPQGAVRALEVHKGSNRCYGCAPGGHHLDSVYCTPATRGETRRRRTDITTR